MNTADWKDATLSGPVTPMPGPWPGLTAAGWPLDATPPDWLALETESSLIWQPLQDAWLWLRFKISQWRWSETRDNRARYLPWFLIPLALYLLWRIPRPPNRTPIRGSGRS